MPDRVGQQLGNYRLVKLLGKGGFAEVYLGQHVRLASKQAAIKLLHLFDVDARKFQEEAETTEKLVHPHIVRLLDFDIEQGTPFLVLDYAPGGSLRTRHPKGSVVPLASVGEYLKELAPALQYAHDKHILHRDIKPDNMLIGRGGELLLSDFGIAVLTQTGRSSFSSAYGIGGTPYYMAPETYRGRPVKESDQYALAVVVYEWLCGSVPFSEGDFIQLGFQHSHEPVPLLREKNPAIPPEVEAVIKKALSKEPKDRFASVQDFAVAFEQVCIPTLPAEEPGPGQGMPDKEMPPDQSSRQRGDAGQPPQHSVVQTPQPSQDETGVQVTNQSVPPGVTSVGRADQSPLPTPVVEQQSQPPPQATLPPQDSITFPPPPPPAQSKRQRSPAVVGILILLTLMLLGGGSLGIYGAATGKWPWNASSGQSPPTSLSTSAQANGTATAQANASVPGRTWHAQNSGTSVYLYGVAWSGSQFVAVGSGTGGDDILTSPDGRTWTIRNSGQPAGTSRILWDVAWSGSQFVAVGVDNPSTSIILTSPDGHAWTAQYASSSQSFVGVTWSGSQFVVVGSTGTITTGIILTSPDGRSWTTQYAGSSHALDGIAGSGSQLVAVGESGTILTSPDGRTWTAQNSGISQNLQRVAWSGSLFVAVGESGTILTSPDGRTWTAQNSGISQSLLGVTRSGSQVVVVGGTKTTGIILTSPDGRSWTTQYSGGSNTLVGVAWSGSQVVAVGGQGTILTSP